MNNTPYYVLQLQHAHIKKDDGISIYNLTNPFRWLDKLDNATQPDAMFPLDDDFNRDGNVWEWCYKCGLKVVTAETAHRGFFVNFCAQNSRNSGKRDLTLRFTHNIDREQGYRMHYSELFDHFSSLHGNASK